MSNSVIDQQRDNEDFMVYIDPVKYHYIEYFLNPNYGVAITKREIKAEEKCCGRCIPGLDDCIYD